jgi:hypothetical protein
MMKETNCYGCKHGVYLGFQVLIGGPNQYVLDDVIKCNTRSREDEVDDPEPVPSFMLGRNPGCDLYTKREECGI